MARLGLPDRLPGHNSAHVVGDVLTWLEHSGDEQRHGRRLRGSATVTLPRFSGALLTVRIAPGALR